MPFYAWVLLCVACWYFGLMTVALLHAGRSPRRGGFIPRSSLASTAERVRTDEILRRTATSTECKPDGKRPVGLVVPETLRRRSNSGERGSSTSGTVTAHGLRTTAAMLEIAIGESIHSQDSGLCLVCDLPAGHGGRHSKTVGLIPASPGWVDPPDDYTGTMEEWRKYLRGTPAWSRLMAERRHEGGDAA